MRSYPSRSENREMRLYRTAQNGLYKLKDMILYPSEVKSLKKKGFVVETIPYSTLKVKNMLICTIDWSHPFSDEIPAIVSDYINGITNTYPKNSINSFAQELFVIAQRANTYK